MRTAQTKRVKICLPLNADDHSSQDLGISFPGDPALGGLEVSSNEALLKLDEQQKLKEIARNKLDRPVLIAELLSFASPCERAGRYRVYIVNRSVRKTYEKSLKNLKHRESMEGLGDALCAAQALIDFVAILPSPTEEMQWNKEQLELISKHKQSLCKALFLFNRAIRAEYIKSFYPWKVKNQLSEEQVDEECDRSGIIKDEKSSFMLIASEKSESLDRLLIEKEYATIRFFQARQFRKERMSTSKELNAAYTALLSIFPR